MKTSGYSDALFSLLTNSTTIRALQIRINHIGFFLSHPEVANERFLPTKKDNIQPKVRILLVIIHFRFSKLAMSTRGLGRLPTGSSL